MAYTGVNIRATSGYVSDGAGYTYSLGEAYPTTRGGQTFGWSTSNTTNTRDRSAAYTPQQAGMGFKSNSGGGTIDFKLDLPAAGQYRIRICAGDFSAGQDTKIVIKDGATVLATISAAIASGSFMDATGALHTAANYAANNSYATFTFAGTQLVLTIGGGTDAAKASVLSSVSFEAAADTTAPTLSSPSATGGTLACSGSVSTNEGNGTLYTVVTASATPPTAAQVKAGQDHTGAAALRIVSQAVSGTGSQSIASGSVTAGTRYMHFMHEDAAANQSTVSSSGSFVVTAASTISGDAVLAGITADGAMGTAPGVITSPVLKNNTGTVLASVTGIVANVYNRTTGALVVRKTGLSSNSSGIVSISDVALVAGTVYAYELDLSATSQGRRLPTAAAA